MGEDTMAMSQRERDRLKVLHEATQGQVTEKPTAEQLKLSDRHVWRMLKGNGRRHRRTWSPLERVEPADR
jgi:hypothetical protein